MLPRHVLPVFPRLRVQRLHEISTALLPPRRVRWCCLHRKRAAKGYSPATRRGEIPPLLHIQAIVTVCTRWIRRIALEEGVCCTEAIHDIMAPHSHGCVQRPFALYPWGAGTCGRWSLADRLEIAQSQSFEMPLRIDLCAVLLDIEREWTLNASLTRFSSYRKCSKRRISGHSAQATSLLRIEGTTKCSRIARGFGCGRILGFAAEVKLKAGLGFRASAAFPVCWRTFSAGPVTSREEKCGTWRT
jgi:hypothetical protein